MRKNLLPSFGFFSSIGMWMSRFLYYKYFWLQLRASPLSLHLHPHLHFNTRNANARKSLTHWRKYQTRMRFYARSLKLFAYVSDMHGGLYVIRQEFFKPSTYYFSLVSTSYRGMCLRNNQLRFGTLKKITSYRRTGWSLRNNRLKFMPSKNYQSI